MIFPNCCTVIGGAPRYLTSTPRLDEGDPRHVAGSWRLVSSAPWPVYGTPRLHQQNVNRSRSHTPTSQTLQSSSPVLPIISRCFQAPLEQSKVLSDSARAFSGAPKSTWSDRGAFRMQQELTIRIAKFWSSWDLWAARRETWCHILTTAVLMVP